MREIKFRAWDKKNKRMIDGWDLEYLNEIFESKKDDLFVIGDDLEVMQFTGLLDKNGTEIYEGDIIHRKPIDALLPGGEYTGAVEWIIERTEYVVKNNVSKWGEYHFVVNKGELEVIGNIYENPELLK